MPFISFIVTYHNEPLTMLGECIGSILSTDLPANEREIVVIDDGSAVSPKDFLLSMDAGIICFRQEHQGLSVARNTGISMSCGEYLQFVDADDCLIPAAYNKLLGQVRQSRMDLLMFRFDMKHPGKGTARRHARHWNGAEFILRRNFTAAVCGCIFKRELMGDLRFKPGVFHEDSLFTPQLILCADTLCDTSVRAYYYRQHEGSIMSRRDKPHITKRLDDSLAILLELKAICQNSKGTAQKALHRCIAQQEMCYIYFIVTLTHSFSQLKQRIKSLRSFGLYPLPLRFYTWKYWLFALFTHLFRP